MNTDFLDYVNQARQCQNYEEAKAFLSLVFGQSRPTAALTEESRACAFTYTDHGVVCYLAERHDGSFEVFAPGGESGLT
jgi:hypothetical protein